MTLGLSAWALTSLIVGNSYKTLEEAHAFRDMHIIENFLASELEVMATVMYENGEWDAMHDYVRGTAELPLSEDALVETLAFTKISFLGIYAGKQLRTGVAVDLETEEQVDYTDMMDTEAAAWSQVVAQFSPDYEVKSFVSTSDGLIAFAAAPVTRSDGEGDYFGHMIVGRRIDATFINRLHEKSEITWDFQPKSVFGLIENTQPDDSLNEEELPTLVLEDGQTKASKIYKLLDGRDAATLTTYTARDTIKLGNKTLNFFMACLAAVLLISLAVLSLALKFILVNPVKGLTAIISNPDPLPKISASSILRREDEVGMLFKSFQKLTIDNENYNRELKEAIEVARVANSAKSDFVSNMSHEIRTPMNGVLGMAEIMKGTHLNEKQKIYVDAISESGTALLAIINDILDFSKIESGGLLITAEPFDLPSMIESVSVLLGPVAHKKGLSLNTEIDRNLPKSVVGDAGRLRQVLMNFIGNAIKFTHEGQVLIRVIGQNISKDATQFRFEVRDTGIGIPQDKLDMIFDKFTQAEDTTTRQYGGTGLGLSISKSIIEGMGGSVGVVSEYGRGSAFWFDLTLERAKPEAVDPAPRTRIQPHL